MASAALSMDARMTIANMTTEWGALAGVFPFDEMTVKYLRSRVPEFSNPRRPGTRGPKSRSGYSNAEIDGWWNDRANLSADADATYAIELELDLATVVPHVSGPNEVKTMVSLPEMQRKHVPIQKAYLLSCVNARFEDLHEAAEVVRAGGKRVADGVEFYLAAASAEVQTKAESVGDWQTLVDAGAIRVTTWLRNLHRPRTRPRAEGRDRDQRHESEFQRPHGRSRCPGLSRFAGGRRGECAGRIHLRAKEFRRASRRALRFGAPKANRRRMFRSRSSMASRRACAGAFSSSIRTI